MPKERSAVAEMENWKAAVVKEQQVASAFEENWGYLKARPEDCKPRGFETRLVKYFDHGVASVKEKRIAVPDDDREHSVDQKVPALTSQNKTSMFRTTSSIYGSRNTLEMFGVAQHGLKSDITKVLF
ncbi:hypothetical protein GUITHDRAFT_100555 [Guillardia theta CCMP2712]|uniref:Uncharacterized protein n=1 Tax=Guillardia theta (strain CCMP2712) TaxID=905079 RepID=L1JYB3_GUITC|nr:hypothetical protein GUITHDRAFT_100555 [Guillardia theta CCMP2712]EKX53571.1 hypothetical protein GUITHDRAFT_100555 [Guillardia theta CCMP2712]|eukprot:XP_005840551.1 hypothetical protein GUITHDRAFT_100555 [Guillardia theta CCMP2712]